MRVRRGYLIALVVVALGGGWSLLHPARGADAYLEAQRAAQAQAGRGLPEAMAALARVRIPPEAHRLTRGCRWYRCYVIEKPTAQAASILPGVMRSLGADNPPTRRLQGVGGCGHYYNQVHGLVVNCAEPAVIDGNFVAVFLGPYLGCVPGPCRWTGATELEITFPSGKAA